MILGTGIDLCDPERLRRASEKSGGRILDRIFTAGEKDYCDRLGDPWPSYAARFAAKEAFVKALGLGLRGGLTWKQVEVTGDRRGRPLLVVHGRAAEILKERGIDVRHLALSHQASMAVAMVLLEGEAP